MLNDPRLLMVLLLGAGVTLSLLIILTFSLMSIDSKIDSDV